MSDPPYMGVIRNSFIYFEYNLRSLVICKHNSLVGHKIIDWVFFFFVLMLLIIGKPNAAVLPVPVCAKEIKSWFDSKRKGIVCIWIGVG